MTYTPSKVFLTSKGAVLPGAWDIFRELVESVAAMAERWKDLYENECSHRGSGWCGRSVFGAGRGGDRYWCIQSSVLPRSVCPVLLTTDHRTGGTTPEGGETSGTQT